MKKALSLLLCCALAAGMTACGSSNPGTSGGQTSGGGSAQTGGEAQTPIEWTAVGYLDSSNYHYQQQMDFCDAVTERSGGRLVINYYGAGELPFTGYEFVSITSDGTAQLSFPGSGYFDTEVPSVGIPGWVRLCGSNQECIDAWEAMDAYADEQFAQYGVERLALWSMAGQAWFGTGKEPTRWADLKGMKIRTHSSIFNAIMEPYGIEPVSITWGEVIPSLQRGVCDGALTGMTSAWASGWAEVTDWFIPMDAQCAHGIVLVNSAALASLPEDLQQIVREEAQNYQDISYEYNETETAKVIQEFVDAGLTCIELPQEDLDEIDAYAAATWDAMAQEYGCEEALAAVRETVGK